MTTLKCPHCGWLFVEHDVVPAHVAIPRDSATARDGDTLCEGSGQAPRNADDNRQLWKDIVSER